MDPELYKTELHHALRAARRTLVWKLDGLSEYDARRPLVPTGSNLLGLVKHALTIEWGHVGATFGRPYEERLGWVDDEAEPDADMWAEADETREQLVGLYERIAAHTDEVIDALPLDAVGRVPWWPAEIADVTLHGILVHTVAELQRHAGHADILRELVDGSAGFGASGSLVSREGSDRRRQYDRIEQAARQAR